MTVNKNDVHEAIKRVSIFTSSVSKQIRLRLQSDTLTISGEDEESGNDAVESISCEYHGDELQIAFNFKYLVEALDNIDSGEAKDDHVLISFSEASKPALISPKSDADNLLMLIMPVRISE